MTHSDTMTRIMIHLLPSISSHHCTGHPVYFFFCLIQHGSCLHVSFFAVVVLLVCGQTGTAVIACVLKKRKKKSGKLVAGMT